MKLSEVAKQYEECMEKLGPCLLKDCPLKENITIRIGDLSDEGSEITWKVNCGSLIGKIDAFLKKETIGEAYDRPGCNQDYSGGDC